MTVHASVHKGQKPETVPNIDDPPPPSNPYYFMPETKRSIIVELTKAKGGEDAYEWSHGDQKCTHHLRTQLPATSCVDASCAVLSFLQGMFYSPVLKAIVARRNGAAVVLTPKDLEAYVRHDDFPQFIRERIFAKLPDLIMHVSTAFGMNPNETSKDLPFLNRISATTVHRPIPYFSDPTLGVKCPKCPKWFAYQKGLVRHQRHVRDCAPTTSQSNSDDYHPTPKRKMRRIYSQRYGVLGSGGATGYRIALPSGWTPHNTEGSQAPMLSPAPRPPYSPPNYFKELGWWDYMSSFSDGANVLAEFTAIPSRTLVTSAEKTGLEIVMNIEKGLLEFSLKVAPTYLVHAQELIEKYHPGLRDALVVE